MKRFDKKSIVLIVLSVLVALMMVGAIYIGTRPQKVEMTTLSPVKLSQETSQSNNFDGVIGYTAEHKTKEGETAATIPSREQTEAPVINDDDNSKVTYFGVKDKTYNGEAYQVTDDNGSNYIRYSDNLTEDEATYIFFNNSGSTYLERNEIAAAINKAVNNDQSLDIFYLKDNTEWDKYAYDESLKIVNNSYDDYITITRPSIQDAGTSYERLRLEPVVNEYHRYTQEQADALNQKIVQVASTCTGSTYDKIKTAYDYLTSNVSYDYSYEKNTPYDALIDNCAVCEGYACAFQLIMQACGVESYIIARGESNTDHCWNAVRLDGEYYLIDTTWGAENHDKYFLFGTDTLDYGNVLPISKSSY